MVVIAMDCAVFTMLSIVTVWGLSWQGLVLWFIIFLTTTDQLGFFFIIIIYKIALP
jgi:hypothetical protein